MIAPARPVWRAFGAIVLLLPGVVAFQPVFGGIRGYLPAALGIVVGVLVAFTARALKFSLAMWFGIVVIAYLVVGGPVAASDSLGIGFIPTLQSLRRLVQLTWQGWGDILTVATPAADIPGPQAIPFLLGLVLAAALSAAAMLTRAVVLPLLIPIAWLCLGIAFGIRNAPTAWWLGGALAVGCLVWTTAHRLARSSHVNARFLVRRARGLSSTAGRAVAAGFVLVLAAGLALGVNLATGTGVNRQVLRDHVSPPLELEEYPSPLTRFRLYEVNLAEEVLFHVHGAPANGRLRLAVMDAWDGSVYNVSQDSGRYLRIGREVPWPPQQVSVDATIAPAAYSDVWVPSFGVPARVEFAGQRAGGLARGLHINRDTFQLLAAARLDPGSSVTVRSSNAAPLSPDDRQSLLGRGIGSAKPTQTRLVPEVLTTLARDWTRDAGSAFEQLIALETNLQQQGKFSDGTKYGSRAGHTAERLAFMFNEDQYVGDDEQYAVAMALMATDLGIPVRVVLGFYPNDPLKQGQDWEVRGTEAHVWVEANIEGAGWVSFDPTPPRDQEPTPNNTVPQPRPKPRVDSPPLPPERYEDDDVQAEEENVEVKDPVAEPADYGPLLWTIGLSVGGLLLLLSPLLIIGLLKLRRLHRRQRLGTPADQMAGAWTEVVDRARDLGFEAPRSRTRHETAEQLQTKYPELPVEPFAKKIDNHVFGPTDPEQEARDATWDEAHGLRRSLLRTRPWYAQAAALFSIRSLRRGKVEAAQSLRHDPDRKARRADSRPSPPQRAQRKG